MRKKKCILCNSAKAKRECRERKGGLICSKCCAAIRNQQCEGCVYYTFAEKYHASRFRWTSKKKSESDKIIERDVDEALKLLEAGNADEAHARMEELLSGYPENHVVQYGMGIVYATKEKYDEALKFFDKAIDIFPYFIQALFNKVVALQKKGDILNCIRTLKKMQNIGDENDSFVKAARIMFSEINEHIMKTDGVDVDTFFACEKKPENSRKLKGR